MGRGLEGEFSSLVGKKFFLTDEAKGQNHGNPFRHLGGGGFLGTWRLKKFRFSRSAFFGGNEENVQTAEKAHEQKNYGGVEEWSPYFGIAHGK